MDELVSDHESDSEDDVRRRGEGDEEDNENGSDGVGDGVEGGEGAGLTAAQRAHQEQMRRLHTADITRERGEREEPYAPVRLGYAVHLFTSPRFAQLEPGVRLNVLLHAVYHHLRHVLEHGGAVAPTEDRIHRTPLLQMLSASEPPTLTLRHRTNVTPSHVGCHVYTYG